MSGKKEEVSSWLRELQQKSWEPEILLSGIVLFGMFQLPDILDELQQYVKYQIHGESNTIDNLIAIFKAGVYWLTLGLILHLFSRGVWVGFVGLSYVFPKGLRVDKLPYSGRFLSNVQKVPPLEKIVDRLEKVSSSLFSISFMFFMLLIGGYCFLFTFVVLPFIIALYGFEVPYESMTLKVLGVYSYVIVGVGGVLMFDLVTLGLLKRIKWLEPVWWPIQRLSGFISISRIYRNVYYVFASNVNKWAFGSILVLFVFISFFVIGNASNRTDAGSLLSRLDLWSNKPGSSYINPAHYDTSNERRDKSLISIQSDVITGNTVKIFVASRIVYEDNIKEYVAYDSLAELEDQSLSKLRLSSVEKFWHIYLNDSLVKPGSFLNYYKQETNQPGYLTYLDIANIPVGLHEIKLAPPPEEYDSVVYEVVQFYRE
ncbi:MAG: hypothetical protein AAF789_01535 [Bacteroidota bacterium]